MSRENISKILSGIDPSFVEECAKQPSERNNMNHSTRRIAVIVAAACLLFALAITAYATGALRSILGSFWGSYGDVLQDPQEQRALGRDDYADWLEGEHKMVDDMLDIANKAVPQDTFVPIEPGSKAGITLLESYYDGEKIALGCQFRQFNLQEPIQYDIDLNDPAYAEMGTLEVREDGAEFLKYGDGYQTTEEDRAEIAARLERDGKVTFVTSDSWLGDHVYANGEDLGCCHGDVDPEGYFTVDPMVMGIGEVELPETCRDLPEITVTLNYRAQRIVYVVEGDTVRCAKLPVQNYPVDIIVKNVNTD